MKRTTFMSKMSHSLLDSYCMFYVRRSHLAAWPELYGLRSARTHRIPLRCNERELGLSHAFVKIKYVVKSFAQSRRGHCLIHSQVTTHWFAFCTFQGFTQFCPLPSGHTPSSAPSDCYNFWGILQPHIHHQSQHHHHHYQHHYHHHQLWRTSPKTTRSIGICEVFFLVLLFSQTRKLPASPAAQSECCSNPSVIYGVDAGVIQKINKAMAFYEFV